jgi:hypothetical protein
MSRYKLVMVQINHFASIEMLSTRFRLAHNVTAIGVVCVTGAANRPDIPVVGMELSRCAAGYGAVFARPNGVSRAGKVGCAAPRLNEVKAGAVPSLSRHAIAVYDESL